MKSFTVRGIKFEPLPSMSRKNMFWLEYDSNNFSHNITLNVYRGIWKAEIDGISAVGETPEVAVEGLFLDIEHQIGRLQEMLPPVRLGL